MNSLAEFSFSFPWFWSYCLYHSLMCYVNWSSTRETESVRSYILRNVYHVIVRTRKASLKSIGQAIGDYRLGPLVHGMRLLSTSRISSSGKAQGSALLLRSWVAGSQEFVPGKYGDSGVQDHMWTEAPSPLAPSSNQTLLTKPKFKDEIKKTKCQDNDHKALNPKQQGTLLNVGPWCRLHWLNTCPCSQPWAQACDNSCLPENRAS